MNGYTIRDASSSREANNSEDESNSIDVSHSRDVRTVRTTAGANNSKESRDATAGMLVHASNRSDAINSKDVETIVRINLFKKTN